MNRVLRAFIFTVFLVLACQLTEEQRGENTFSFDKLYDSLSRFDSVQILVKDPAGTLQELIFHGPVDSPAQLKRIPARNYDGGKATISILGYKDGELVYSVDKTYDGSGKRTEANKVVRLPGTTLETSNQMIQIMEDDSVPVPKISILPDELADKSLEWNSSNPDVVSIGSSHFLAKTRGTAEISAHLVSDPSKSLKFSIKVVPNPLVPDDVVLHPDTLFVAADGASAMFKVVVSPSSASTAVTWHVQDTGIAEISESGEARGRRKGLVRAWAASKSKPTKVDSAWISVSDPVPVQSIRFWRDSVDLFMGGAEESLKVVVEPSMANPDVDYEVGDDSKVELKANRIKALAVGATTVAARSKQNSAQSATMKIKVHPAQKVDSVVVKPRTLTLFTGGETLPVSATVYGPTVSTKVRWRSTNPDIATVDSTGKVTPVTQGKARIIAVSLADSLRTDSAEATVKVDPPQVFPGRDTVIAPGRTVEFNPTVYQEYGIITEFKWDLDGDSAWDGVSEDVKPVSFRYDRIGKYSATLSLKDSEKNTVTVYRKVEVSDSPLLLVILSPSRDTVVNRPSITVHYMVNDVAMARVVSLKNGPNNILIDTANTLGMARDSVQIFLDTVPPLVKIVSPTPDQNFRNSKIPVTWTLDGTQQETLNSEDLGTPDGAKTITREFTDEAGNKGSAKVQVVLDTKPPVIRITSPSDGMNTKLGTIGVTWYVDDVKQSMDTTETLADGPNMIKRKAEDAAGNRDSTTVRVNYFSKGPEVKILSPSEGTVTAQKRISVSWTVAGLAQSTDTVADLVEGPNVITRKASDIVGNESIASVTVTLNTKVPEVLITSPTPGAATNQATVDVAWSINGAAQPVTAESLKVEGENTIERSHRDSLGLEGKATLKVFRDTQAPNPPKLTVKTAVLNNQNPSEPAVWTWVSGGDNAGGTGMRTPPLYRLIREGIAPITTPDTQFSLANPAEGMHTLVVQEKDRAGNWSAISDTGRVRVDRVPPPPPIVTGASVSSNPSWSWTSGGGDGVGIFRYRIDNGSYSAETRAIAFNPHAVSDEDHTVYVQERNEFGSWSTDGFYKVAMDRSLPTASITLNLCSTAGSATDTVESEMDSQGFRTIFDGKSFKGWWSNCQTGHSGGSTAGAIWGIDTIAKALSTKSSSGSIGGVLMTNKIFSNYEIVMDIWPEFLNDAGIFHRTPANGKCYQTTLDYINACSLAGAWGEGGFTSFDYRPFSFNGNESTISIPGNNNGPKSNWTTFTSTLNPTTFGCSTGGCTASDYANVWNTNGWNQVRVEVFGTSPRVRTYIRKFGATAWTPVLDHTSPSTAPPGAIGLNVHGGGRWGVNPNWYRNIKVRELDADGNPVGLP